MSAHLCTRGGKQPTPADLAVVERFAEFLRHAGPAPSPHNQPDDDDQQQPEHRVDNQPEHDGDS